MTAFNGSVGRFRKIVVLLKAVRQWPRVNVGAEDAWNTRNPERVTLAYTEDSQWRNRAEFFSGRAASKEFLQRKWTKELDYRLKKELWSFTENRISVRFEYEWQSGFGLLVSCLWQRTVGVC